MVQKVRHYHSISPVILGLPCVMVGPDDLAFGFSYFSMGLAFKNRKTRFKKNPTSCKGHKDRGL